MCIAIARPANSHISKETLQQCFDSNPDGAGFCVEHEGNLQIHKGFFTFESFYNAYEPFQHQKALIHFRIKTHGLLNTDNCHPFSVSDEVVFIHNGIIQGVPHSDTESDTIVFNNMYIKPTVRNWGKSSLVAPAFKGLVEKFIGGSKLAFFIKGEEEFLIYNEKLGNYSEGVWYSNTSWKPYIAPVVKPYVYPPLKPSTTITTPLWESKSYPKKELSISWLGETYTEGSYVELNWNLKDKFGHIPKGSKGFVSAVWSGGRMDIDFDFFGLVLDVHPAKTILLANNLIPLSLDTWECSL
jgi:hypothetical protein